MNKENDCKQFSEVESALLQRLDILGPCRFDELCHGLPEYSWTQLFLAVDRLYRDGVVILKHPDRLSTRQRGFGYVIESRMNGSTN